MDVLPFDRAFFAGGANGVRGWTVRDLGPGFTQQEELNAGYVPGVGDVQLDVGFEFRKELTDAFGAAWFSDAGNVWVNQTSSSSSAQEVEFSLRSLAWGAGLGLRFDFEFFLLRLDGALRLHDPAQVEGQRWIGQGSPRGMVHLGIGHPF
jgi:outer membrane protein assembly factor BamA